MFYYCKDCAIKNNIPDRTIKTEGTCEICSQPRMCNVRDLPSDIVNKPLSEKEKARDEAKLRMALGIISGRISRVESLSNAELDTLGYDPYRFSGMGEPSLDDLKHSAEDIIVRYLLKLKGVIT